MQPIEFKFELCEVFGLLPVVLCHSETQRWEQENLINISLSRLFIQRHVANLRLHAAQFQRGIERVHQYLWMTSGCMGVWRMCVCVCVVCHQSICKIALNFDTHPQRMRRQIKQMSDWMIDALLLYLYLLLAPSIYSANCGLWAAYLADTIFIPQL